MTETQKCLHHIAENMRMDKSISKEGYEYFQQAIKALEQKPCVPMRDLSEEELKHFAEEMKKVRPQVVEQEPRWIPVSERLPEEETDVLICNRNGDIALSRGSYSTEVENDFIWYTSGWRFGKVIAWMPLPEPYNTESEVEE